MKHCLICHSEQKGLIPASTIRPSLAQFIKEQNPAWQDDSAICPADLTNYRGLYVQSVLERDKGELSQLERQVLDSLSKHEVIARDLSVEKNDDLTLGERLADRVAAFGGSWMFIILFWLVLIIWIAINSVALLSQPFDPYPFILLNLLLSCIAALQAPVIMMSQNRQESKDRVRSQHDYQVNLKAELEIRHLHEKVDHLLMQQWQRLLEIQQIQLDLLEELTSKKRGTSVSA